MQKRKPGAQPGNRNALKHGRYSTPDKVARRDARRAADVVRVQREREWAARAPVTDYDAICQQIRAWAPGMRKPLQ